MENTELYRKQKYQSLRGIRNDGSGWLQIQGNFWIDGIVWYGIVVVNIWLHAFVNREGNGNPLLPGKSHGRRSLVGCSPWGRKESDTTETTKHAHMLI